MARKKREPPVSYRPPESLRAEFHARVAASGMSVNAFITRTVFGREAPRARRQSSLDQKSAALLLAAAARINDSLKETVADNHGQAATEAAVASCHAELSAIRALLMQALGRLP